MPLLESVLWHSGVLRYCVYHIVWCVCVLVNDPNVECCIQMTMELEHILQESKYCQNMTVLFFRWFDLTVAVVHHIPVFVACVY